MRIYRWASKYQSTLNSNFKRITNLCGFAGTIFGLALWFLTVKYIFDYYGFDLDKGDAQFSHPYLFGMTLLVLLILYIFTLAFVCHWPFVLAKKITLKEAFQAVFLWRHPERWSR
ncbi:MAG: hypothetical protein GY820_12545 [Gammaproteobacteria bacterium]|nr:hypothetical protein [Gammaproteobacteria bacterium]